MPSDPTNPTPSEPLELRGSVEQCDRNAAASYVRGALGNKVLGDEIKGRMHDDHYLAQLFARHREQALAQQASTIGALEAENTTMRRILKSARRDLEGIYSGSEGPITTAKSNRLCARRIEAGGALRALILDLSTLREEKEGG